MTVSTTPPAGVDELIPQARELAAQEGGIPSKDRLMKAFRIGRPKASQIHERLIAERTERREQRRRVLIRAVTRKARTTLSRTRPHPLPAAPVSPGVGPAVPQPEPQVTAAVEGPRPMPPTPFRIPPGKPRRPVATWPVMLLALPAFVAIWSGWVDLGRLTGFGVVHPLPGIADQIALDTAITLPVGLETYAAYALYVWLSGRVPQAAAQFARKSAIGSLVLGALGQVAYHLMVAAGMQRAPWWITTVVACLPVAVLGMGAALRHLVHADQPE